MTAAETIAEDKEIMRMLDATLVDFTDIDDIIGFASLLCQSASLGGMFLCEGENRAIVSQVRTTAKTWLREVRGRLAGMPVADALTVIPAYDLIHRIVYSLPADSVVVNRFTLRAFDALMRGDKSVDVYTLFRQIGAGIRRKDAAYFDRPLQWYSRTLYGWYKDFQTGRCRTQLGVGDTIERVTLLLQSDLWAFEAGNEPAFKQRLFDAHRHLADTLVSPEPATGHIRPYHPATLQAFSRFITASIGYLSPEAHSAYTAAIARALLSAPETNRFQRKVLELQQEI